MWGVGVAQGTGLFDGLDVELLVEILRHTGLKQRLHCATSVCKAWRLLASHQELFSQLELCPNMRYRSYEKLNIAESRLLPFVRWLPKQAAPSLRALLAPQALPPPLPPPQALPPPLPPPLRELAAQSGALRALLGAA